MAANQFVPITDLPTLPGAPSIGQAMVIQAAGVTYQVDARMLPLINDMLLTWGDQRASLPGSRFITAGAGISLTNTGDELQISAPGGSGIVVSIVAGSGISVDNSDPANPVVAASMPAQNILYSGSIDTAIFPDARAVTNGPGIEFTISPGIFDIHLDPNILGAVLITGADQSAQFPNSLQLTAGTGITLTPGAGTLTIDAAGGGSVATVNDGRYIDVDNTDPVNPIVNLSQTKQSPNTTGGTPILNASNNTVFVLTLTEDITSITFNNVPGGPQVYTATLVVIQDGTGGWDVTWPAAFMWSEGTTPVLDTTPGSIQVLQAFTYDGGASWFAAQVMSNVA